MDLNDDKFINNIDENNLQKSEYDLNEKNNVRHSARLKVKQLLKCEEVIRTIHETFDVEEDWSLDEMYDECHDLKDEKTNQIVNDEVEVRPTKHGKKKVKMKKNVLKKIKCDICQVICNSQTLYEKHKLKHFRTNIYQCNECQATFSYRKKLIKHIKSVHLGVEQQKEECAICGKLVLYLDIHVLRHTSSRFVCELCNKSFLRQAYYVEHLKIHSGIRSYVCDICGNQFVKKGNLQSHLASHEKNRDKDGAYLPMKPRGLCYEKLPQVAINRPAGSEEVGLEERWDNVSCNSRACDTADLSAMLQIPEAGTDMVCREGRSVCLRSPIDMTGDKWLNALLSSRATDTTDLSSYQDFLDSLSVDQPGLSC